MRVDTINVDSRLLGGSVRLNVSHKGEPINPMERTEASNIKRFSLLNPEPGDPSSVNKPVTADVLTELNELSRVLHVPL